MVAPPVVTFGSLLRQRRADASLTQEELAEAARVGARTVSDLERGVARTARKETARRLAHALRLTGADRDTFLAVARGRAVCLHNRDTAAVAPAFAVSDGDLSAAAWRVSPPHAGGWLPRAWLRRVAAALDQQGIAAARSVLGQWRASGLAEESWLSWADSLVALTAAGRMQPGTRRQPPSAAGTPFVGRERSAAILGTFIERIKAGHGGLALVLGPAGMGKSRLIAESLCRPDPGYRIEWVTFDHGEAGYRGWRRLLAPLWSTFRRTELPPPGLLAHAGVLDEMLLAAGDREPVAGKLFSCEVSAAVTALLAQLSASQPLVLVVDDAHRGGVSSDELLLDVARRVSAHRVGIVAGVRPDEVQDQSPIGAYDDQADGRAGLDPVVPIRLPPLDQAAAAGLLRARAGAEPPASIVEAVLRQTAGRPALILKTRIHVDSDGLAGPAWNAGDLDPEGFRVLESTIRARPPDLRAVLQAAAVRGGGVIDSHAVAAILARPVPEIEAILDAERRRGSILCSHPGGWRFQHDSWIDALVSSCPAAWLHELHARCLALLRDDPGADAQRLARHAIGAGVAAVGATELVAIARKAADEALADYAFGEAGKLYEVAAQHAAGAERIELLIGQAEAWRFGGRWTEASDLLRQAAKLAASSGLVRLEARALMRLGRLTWTYGLDEQLFVQQLRDVAGRLPAGETALRAQVQAVLAMRLSTAWREYGDEPADLARAARRQLRHLQDIFARADVLLGVHDGLQDHVGPDELLKLDAELLELGVRARSAYHMQEGLNNRIVDLLSAGRLLEVPAALRAYQQFAEQTPTPFVAWALEIHHAMFALASGRFADVARHTGQAIKLSEPWGQHLAREAVDGQIGWMLLETGDLPRLAAIPAVRDVSPGNEPLWTLALALAQAEREDAGSAIHILRAVCDSSDDLHGLPRGRSRIATLAIAAAVLSHPVVLPMAPPEWARRVGRRLASELAAHKNAFVLAGWPAVFLGSKQRYVGLAHLAAGDAARAARHLTLAVAADHDFAALCARSRFDRTRALLALPGSDEEAVAELRQVHQTAVDLGMAGLASHAARYDHARRSVRPSR